MTQFYSKLKRAWKLKSCAKTLKLGVEQGTRKEERNFSSKNNFLAELGMKFVSSDT